jgi:DNA-binding NarL/FixJ family response regulator
MTSNDQANTLLIVDDHPIYREGLQELIAHWDDFRVCGVAANGREALEMYHKLQPDIVLMDVNMPVMDGAEATRLILEEFPKARVVMLAISNHDPELLEAIEFGACGYTLKDINARQLHILLRGWVASEHQHGEERFTE